VWGDSGRGGTDAPSGNDYTKIYSTNGAFAALKADGSIKAWGDPNRGGTGAPAGSGYTKIYSTKSAFAAIKADGSIAAWGSSSERQRHTQLNKFWCSHYQRAHPNLLCLSHPTP
jgi:hypothetical protein